MSSMSKIVNKPAEVEARLKELNLTLSPLHDVLAHMVSHSRGLSLDHPTWMKGISAAGEGVYMLRTRLRDRGWIREEESSFELTVFNDGERDLALNIAKGTTATGNPNLNVETAYSRGPQTSNAVECNNQLIFDLPPPPVEEIEQVTGKANRHTWYLLYTVDGSKIRAELSLPLGLSAERHISQWHERIILPEINIDDYEVPSPALGLTPRETVVKVSRKKRTG